MCVCFVSSVQGSLIYCLDRGCFRLDCHIAELQIDKVLLFFLIFPSKITFFQIPMFSDGKQTYIHPLLPKSFHLRLYLFPLGRVLISGSVVHVRGQPVLQ